MGQAINVDDLDDETSAVTLSKGGTAERTVKVKDIDIPDLWHIAMLLSDQKVVNGLGEAASDKVLEVWHLAHDLKKALLLKA